MVDGVAVNGQVSRISGLNTQRNYALLAARSDVCVAHDAGQLSGSRVEVLQLVTGVKADVPGRVQFLLATCNPTAIRQALPHEIEA